jgi:3',5'-cyclic AMP phosphodiesterase CpdA
MSLALLFAVALARTPYVQSVGPDRALIAWATDAPADGALLWGESAAVERVEPGIPNAAVQFVRLGGLRPATVYHYRVRAAGEPLGEPASFRTAPPPGHPRARFAALGDFGVDTPVSRAVVAAIAAAAPDFVITAGDNAYTHGARDEVERFYLGLLAPIAAFAPIFPSLGNHDYRTDEARPFLQAVYLPDNNPARSERYYSFDWGPLHMVALDSHCLREKTSACDAGAQRAWAEADLAGSKAPWKVVYFHHPPHSSGEHGSDEDTARLVPLFERAGVALVVTGHDHDYERIEPPGGPVYIVTGGGGAKLRGFEKAVPHSKVRAAEHHFVVVEVDQGLLAGRALRPDGTQIDTFSIARGEVKLPEEPDRPPPASESRETEPAVRAIARAFPDRAEAPAGFLLDASFSRGLGEFAWDLGDGRSATGVRAVARYTRPGAYRVRLRAHGEGGAEATDEVEIVAEDGNPIATEQRRRLRYAGLATGTLVVVVAFTFAWWQSRRRAKS